MKVLLKIYDSGKSGTIEEHEISWFEIKTIPVKEANSNEYLILHIENGSTFMYKNSRIVEIGVQRGWLEKPYEKGYKFVKNNVCKIVLKRGNR